MDEGKVHDTHTETNGESKVTSLKQDSIENASIAAKNKPIPDSTGTESQQSERVAMADDGGKVPSVELELSNTVASGSSNGNSNGPSNGTANGSSNGGPIFRQTDARGIQFADENGGALFETIYPANLHYARQKEDSIDHVPTMESKNDCKCCIIS
mmetsp:Transcript_14870/g.16823  ORF Transcript_14870/g.16823 Transcript_14870/m.16823 type:complete len:156 (-) Transcript_14870:316-783(-)|eukprot:CAMPEP_0184018628 /NCGR_PEP_ID=MMETSP0954-20121128/8256_1 /TAXON_ID=627963 /ORGANISM="Aplanochytrium sp, Strain PBS07" /LENGTH=155 /DNA_ID=CAMNT_0026300113 /DNA_START=276 /DNA_END=743 /DNA_ORIENTATION=-